MKYINIYFFLIVVLLSSCTDNLDLISRENVSDGSFWKTAGDFKLAVTNLYNCLERFDMEDTQSDIAFNNGNSISNGSYQKQENSSTWTDAYVYIRNANNIIEKGYPCESDPEIQHYIAEAKFFRAYNYWKLFKSFGGVPIIKQPLEFDNKNELFKPRASREETVNFIIDDLKDAVKYLPQQKELSNNDIGRITKGAALSLMARIALFEGTWQKFRQGNNANYYLEMAVSAAADVMNSNQYALFTDKGQESYRYLFLEVGDDSKECILDRRYERYILGHATPYMYDETGYLATKKLADMYLDKNGLPITNSNSVFHGYETFQSEYKDRDPRMTMTWLIPGTYINRFFHPIDKVENWPDFPQRNHNTGYILYKYISEDPIGNNSSALGDNSLFDYDRHLIRYGEILLIYAEAIYEKNDYISDNDLNKSLNLLRDRVNMPHLTNTFVNQNGLNMRQEIRRERTVELALEGFRYDDLRRWKTAEIEMPEDVKGIKIRGSEWENKVPYNSPFYQDKTDANGFLIVEKNRVFNDKHYLQPLPTKEIAFYVENGYTLEQNPGW